MQEQLEKSKLTVHQKINLTHYLYIANLRIQQQKYIEKETQDALLGETDIKREMEAPFFRSVPDGFREAEVTAFLYYYYSRSEELGNGLRLDKNTQIANWSQNLLDKLVASFPKLRDHSDCNEIF